MEMKGHIGNLTLKKTTNCNTLLNKTHKMILMSQLATHLGKTQTDPYGNAMQDKMEDLSVAYIKILAAENGYTLTTVGRDNDGVDVTISCKGYPASGCKIRSPKLDIQLKASYSKVKIKKNGDISFKLEAKNYNNLILSNRMIPAILVLLHMPKDQNKWVKHTKQCLKITKCAYWVSLKHLNGTTNKESITINIPKENMLSSSELKRIMIRVSNEEEL